MPCEDAPCCGCCGLNAWYQEDLAAAEARFESLDDDFYDDFYDDFESSDEPGPFDDDSIDRYDPPVGTGRPRTDEEAMADRLEARDTKARGWS